MTNSDVINRLTTIAALARWASSERQRLYVVREIEALMRDIGWEEQHRLVIEEIGRLGIPQWSC